MNLAQEAYALLLPDIDDRREFSVSYSGHFSSYNANVRYTKDRMHFNLSTKWKDISPEIQIGLLQSLMLKAFKAKGSTMNIDLYNIFMKKLSSTAPKYEQEPLLVGSFQRVNEKYFAGMVEMPNLVFGEPSLRKLGSYAYATDTVTISPVLKDDDVLLDYVVYHELLHKKLKYSVSNGRHRHHTTEFRTKEKEFENAHELDRRLSNLARKKRFLGIF
jgi:hypothetical protein